LSFKFNSPKWEVKNTYVLGMLARRPFYPPSFWRTGGLEGLSAVFLEGLSAVFLEGLVPIHKFI
jgi:hypothetical protein